MYSWRSSRGELAERVRRDSGHGRPRRARDGDRRPGAGSEAAGARRRQHRRRARQPRARRARASRPRRSCSGPSAPRSARRATRRCSSTSSRPAPRLVIFGAVDYAAALARLARAAGWRPFVCDPRSQFATRERFPDAEEVIVAWPDEAFARLGGIDRATYIAVLTHDPKLDDAALTLALRSDAALRGRDGQPPRAGAATRAAAGRRRAARSCSSGSPRRSGSTSERSARGDRAFDHGRGRRRAERPRRRPPLAGRGPDPRGGRLIGGARASRPARPRASARPKQLAELDGVPLLEHSLRTMHRGAGGPRRGRARAGAEEIAAGVDLHGADPVVCARWEEGQSASLACGLAELADCEAVVVTLGRPAARVARRDPARDRRP